MRLSAAFLCAFVSLCCPAYSAIAPGPAQNAGVPRDPEKLLKRAQRFWTAVAAGRRLQASEFVLPERKESFVSGTPLPVLKANVVAINVTDRPTQASVQVGIEVLGQDLESQRSSSWTITDLWVWRKGNWYVDLADSSTLFKGNGRQADRQKTPNELERNFQLVSDSLDLGELTEGQYFKIEVPIRYAGDSPVSVDTAIQNSLVALDASSTVITSQSTHLIFQVNTEGWNGPFDLPLPLKIKDQAVAIERRLVVHGNVFAPVVFRQDPNNPVEVGREVSIFVRNNSSQQVGIRYVSVDAKFDIIRQPTVLDPNQEAEVVLKLRPNALPDRLSIVLDRPLYGRDTYSYQFKNLQ
jgi:hypothetical protein